MLPAMLPLSLDVMRGMAALGGFSWSDEELEAIRGVVERMQAGLDVLASLPLGEVEPSGQYRMF